MMLLSISLILSSVFSSSIISLCFSNLLVKREVAIKEYELKDAIYSNVEAPSK